MSNPASPRITPVIVGLVALGVMWALASRPSAVQAVPIAVYSNDFQGAVGSAWSNTSTDTTPVGARRFLGQFRNDTVTLSLSGLPAHSAITVSFDLFVIRSWDGDHASFGPDIFDLDVAGGPADLVHTTFSCFTPPQAYPGSYPGSSNPRGTGAVETNTLGYSFPACTVPGGSVLSDAVYRFNLTFPHSASSLALIFSGSMAQVVSIEDESWGLDNVVVSLEMSEPTGSGANVGGGAAAVGAAAAAQARENRARAAAAAQPAPTVVPPRTGTGATILPPSTGDGGLADKGGGIDATSIAALVLGATLSAALLRRRAPVRR